MDIIEKLKQSGLVGRSGSGFPTWQKWQMVKGAEANKKFVVVNGSEGEPGVKKDGYILEKHLDELIEGIRTAIEFLRFDPAGEKVKVAGIIYLNADYHKKFESKLKKAVGHLPVTIFKKNHETGYIGGEESAILNNIEGNRVKPRLRPPFPTYHGLWNYPSLVGNIETFRAVAQVIAGKYAAKRLYTIGGDCLWTGVFEMSESMSIEEILKTTNNYPKFNFFVQVGGNASGEVLNSRQLNQRVTGAGAITVYSLFKHKPMDLIQNWLNFYLNESCGQCTSCREGTYRLTELAERREADWRLFAEILNSLRESSFCGLGCSVPAAVESYIKNIILGPEGEFKFPNLNSLKENFIK